MSTNELEVVPNAPLTAGAQLRAARLAKGVHLAVLSGQLKVPVRQLEALENDVLSQGSAPAFVRALAQAVCRQLRVDAQPVLAALPPVVSPLAKPMDSIEPLQTVHGHKPAWASMSALPRGIRLWAVLIALAVAGFIWWPRPAPVDTPVVQEPPVVMGAAEPAEASSSSPAQSPLVAPPLAEAKPASVPTASEGPVSPDPALGLRLRVSQTMWVEVRDAQGQWPIKRLVKLGETVDLPSSGPLFIYLAKADRAELSWQGKAVDLSPHTQNNEVRLRLPP